MKTSILFTFLFVMAFCFGQVNYDDSIQQLIVSNPIEEHPSLYNSFSIQSLKNGKTGEALKMARMALKLAKNNKDTTEQYFALLNISNIHYEEGIFDSSINLGLKALELAIETRNNTLIARANNQLGIVYLSVPMFDKSLSHYIKSLKIIEDTLPNISKEKNLFYKSLVLNNIGTVYSKMGQLEKALEFQRRALKIRRLLADTNGIASCLQNIGVIYEKKMHTDSALLLYNSALELRKILGNNQDMAELLLNIGIIKRKLKQYEVAESKLKEAIEIFENHGDNRYLSEAYFNIAVLYMETKHLDIAYNYIIKCINVSKIMNYKIKEKDAFGLLSDYYAKKGNYRKAWESQKKYLALNDSIFNADMTGKIAEIQTKYEIEKQEKEIEILTKDKEIQALKIKRKSTQVYILVIVVFLIVLMLIITFLMLNRRRLKQKQIETELEKRKILESKLKEKNTYQSKQLTTHALNMLQKNKLLTELDIELKTFMTKIDDASKKRINNIRRQIKRNMNSEKDWDLFKLYFEEVNKNFFKTLKEKCGKLTTGDQKLAALIKLNLNIKEAAAVLNISPDSLRKARYRLRKKLKLDYKDNLTDYLNKIA